MAVTEAGRRASSALDDLYRRHGSEVYRYAYAVLGNHADAEDVTQTTFLNAYRALEQGVRPRKPSNWLLAIASNAIKQRFRHEQSRPREVELDDRTAGSEAEERDGPTVGELLAALARIPPQQRQAIVLREFEGRSYAEIADILGVTTGALETLLFRARRSLAEELEHQLTCTEAQLAISRAADGRLGRKERRRLREHLGECGDCAHFANLQKRHRTALKGLLLLPVPVSLSLVKGLEGTASAATFPVAVGAGSGATLGAGAAGAGGAAGFGGAASGGLFAGGVAVKAAAVVAAATVAGGAVVTGATQTDILHRDHPAKSKRGERVGQTAPRGVLVPGNGVARGKATAPGQVHKPTTPGKSAAAQERASAKRAAALARASAKRATGRAHAAAARAKTSRASRSRGATARATSATRSVRKSTHPTNTKPTTTRSQPSGQGHGKSMASAPTVTSTDTSSSTSEPTASEPSAITATTDTTTAHGNGASGGAGNGQANGRSK